LALSSWQQIFGEARVAIDLRISQKHGLSELGPLLKQRRSLLRRFPAVILWRPSDLLGAKKRVESLIAAARSADHVLIFMQVKESQTEEEHQATHDFQAGLRH
jgi:hypothetical protein